MHRRADHPFEMVKRRRFDALCTTPVERNVAPVAGLRVERQYFVAQPLTKLLQVSAGCWAKTKESADSSSMPLPLATAKFVRGKRFSRRTELRGKPMHRIWIDLIETFRKSAVLLHELELSRETELPFVRHACHQCGFVSGESPQVLGVWIGP